MPIPVPPTGPLPDLAAIAAFQASDRTVTVYQGDDPVIPLIIFDENGPYNLTDKRIEIVVKTKSTLSDDDALFTLSSEASIAEPTAAIIITSLLEGLAEAHFDDRLPDDGELWYHAVVADITDAQLDRHTWAFGLLEVLAV